MEQQETSMESLRALWATFGDTPTIIEGDVELIDEPFLHFPVGTDREHVWRWFEAQNKEFSVGALQNSERK